MENWPTPRLVPVYCKRQNLNIPVKIIGVSCGLEVREKQKHSENAISKNVKISYPYFLHINQKEHHNFSYLSESSPRLRLLPLFLFLGSSSSSSSSSSDSSIACKDNPHIFNLFYVKKKNKPSSTLFLLNCQCSRLLCAVAFPGPLLRQFRHNSTDPPVK